MSFTYHPKKKKRKTTHGFLVRQGTPNGPARAFSPSRQGQTEIIRLIAVFNPLSSFMAAKTVRLPSDQFRARGYRTTPTPYFLLKSKKNSGGKTRIGVVVGTAVHKTAVKRNFWKRQARATVASLAKGGNDILMIVSPSANRLTRKQFRAEIVKTLTRSELA